MLPSSRRPPWAAKLEGLARPRHAGCLAARRGSDDWGHDVGVVRAGVVRAGATSPGIEGQRASEVVPGAGRLESWPPEPGRSGPATSVRRASPDAETAGGPQWGWPRRRGQRDWRRQLNWRSQRKWFRTGICSRRCPRSRFAAAAVALWRFRLFGLLHRRVQEFFEPADLTLKPSHRSRWSANWRAASCPSPDEVPVTRVVEVMDLAFLGFHSATLCSTWDAGLIPDQPEVARPPLTRPMVTIWPKRPG